MDRWLPWNECTNKTENVNERKQWTTTDSGTAAPFDESSSSPNRLNTPTTGNWLEVGMTLGFVLGLCAISGLRAGLWVLFIGSCIFQWVEVLVAVVVVLVVVCCVDWEA